MSDNILILLTKSHCPRCDKFSSLYIKSFKSIMEENNIIYKSLYDPEFYPDLLLKEIGDMLLPIFVIADKELIVGDDPDSVTSEDILFYEDDNPFIDFDGLIEWITENIRKPVNTSLKEDLQNYDLLGIDRKNNDGESHNREMFPSVRNSHVFYSSVDMKL